MNPKLRFDPIRFLLATAAVIPLMACGLTTILQDDRIQTPDEVLEAEMLPSETLTSVPPTAMASETPQPPTEEAPPTEPLPPTPTALPAGPTIPLLSGEDDLEIDWIQMVDSSRGWAIGDIPGGPGAHVLVTGDGGESFRDVSPPIPQPVSPESTLAAHGFFWDAEVGWVIYITTGSENPVPAEPLAWFTMDGGATWAFGGGLPLTGLEGYVDVETLTFSDTDHGWFLAHVDAGMSHDYVELFRTEDGGGSWSRIMDPMSIDSPQACRKNGMVFVSPEYGWLTKDCGGVIDGVSLDITDDGGATWWNLPIPPPETDPTFFATHVCGAFDPVLFAEGSGSLVIHCSWMDDFNVKVDHLYTTDDGGLHWETHPYPGGKLLALNPAEGWALGKENYQTTDGGKTWELIGKTTWEGQFSFVDDLHGWAVVRATGGDGEALIALVRTIEGGRRWEMLEPVMVAE